MPDDRKKPGVAFWATVVLVAALLMYPLSIGPSQWVAWNLPPPRSALAGPHEFYAPIRWVCRKYPKVDRLTFWYIGLWVDWNKAPGVNLPPGARFPSSWSSWPWD